MNVNNCIKNFVCDSPLVTKPLTDQTTDSKKTDFVQEAVESVLRCRNNCKELQAVVEKVSLNYGFSIEQKDLFITSILTQCKQNEKNDVLWVILEKFDKIKRLAFEEYCQASRSYSLPIKIEIAKLAIQHHASCFSSNVQNFGITDQAALVELAKFAAQNGGNVAYHIQNYGIADQAVLIELAKFIAQTEDVISCYLQNFAIQDQAVLVEIAKLIAQQSRSNISQYIQDYGLTDQAVLIEIAKIAVQRSGVEVSMYIQNYGIKDQAVLLDIAKLAIQSGCDIFQYLHHYGFKDPATRIEIAKIVAQDKGINLQGLTDQALLIELAKLEVQKEDYVSFCIQNYGIEDQAALIEIAKLDAQRSGNSISKYIQKYGIKDQTALIEIAKLAAQNHGYDSFSKYIQNYGIKDQATIIEIAKINAKHSGEDLSRNIQNYGFTDESLLIELAKLAAQQSGYSVSAHIKNYAIKDQAALIEIAKLAAKNDGFGILIFIKNYNITDQSVLIELAKIAVEQPNNKVSQYIQNYGIVDETALIEIAMIAVQQPNKNDVALFIKNYGITDQNALVKIAKFLAQQDGLTISRRILDFKITSASRRLEIFIEAFINNIGVFELIDNYELPDDDDDDDCQILLGNLNMLGRIYCIKSETEEVIEDLIDFYEFKQMYEIVKVLKKVSKDPLLLRPSLIWLICFLCICHANKINPQELSPEINALFLFRNPTLRYSLTRELLAYMASYPQELQGLKDFHKKMRSHSVLSTSYLFLLKQKGLSDARHMAEMIQNKALSRNVLFKEASLHLGLLETLDIFYKDISLEMDAKERILKNVINSKDKKDILNIFCAIKGVYQLTGNLLCLKNADNEQALHEEFQKAFCQKFSIETIADFSNKFRRTLHSFRNNTAIFSYAASLAKLGGADREALFTLFRSLIYDILENKFTATRYEASEHLDKIFASRPDLCCLWKKGQSVPFQEIGWVYSAQKTVDLAALVKRSFDEGHVHSKDLPHLYDYLTEANPDVKCSLFEQNLKAPKDESLTDDQKKFYEFQIHLIGFIRKGQELKVTLENLELALAASPFPISHQFYQDLQGLFKNLQPKESTREDFQQYIAVDSDDPCDLLLSGTEVEGSCQRVNGDPDKNKCLLAYLIDGKNRLLAIKDGNGIIKARSILRLLWDEQNQKPVLFMERIYPSILSQPLENALIQFAKIRASELNLNLTSKEAGKGMLYASVLHSLGGKAPYEYVDAGSGINTGSKWSISPVFLLQA
jgi:hypothetical protein